MLINKILLLVFLISFNSIQAQDFSTKLLPCLGQEEAKLFKQKKISSLYTLNQELINIVVNSPDLKLTKKFHTLICKRQVSASKNTLLYALLHKKNIFIQTATNTNKIKFFLSQIPALFFSYIAKVQSEMPTADCLNKNIPEIPYFLERYKYLQNDLTSMQLLEETNKIKKIFFKLKTPWKLFKKCNK